MRGFSTIELTLALMILSVAVVVVTLASFGTPTMLLSGHQEREAVMRAHALLEQAMVTARSDIAQAVPIASSTIAGVESSLTVESLSDDVTVRIGSHVSWYDVQGKLHTYTLTGLSTDPSAVSGSEFCSASLASDWKHPVLRSYTLSKTDLLPSSLSSTYAIAHIVSTSDLLFVAADTTGQKADPTLFIFTRQQDTSAPTYRGSIDNAPSTKTGLAALATDGSYIYAANAFGPTFTSCTQGPNCSQLQVMDTRTPEHPALLTSFQLPTSTAPFATGTGGQASGKSIYYQKQRVYLGLTKTASAQGQEFVIIDTSTPASPRYLGGFHIGRTVNRVLVHGNVAYLATDDSAREFIVLDITDPAHIALIQNYDAPGTANFGFGKALARSGTTLFAGRTYVGNAPELLTLDSATSPIALTAQTDPGTVLTPTSIVDLRIRDTLLIALTTNDIRLWSTEAGNYTPYALSLVLPHFSTGTALACHGDTLYAGSTGTDGTGYISIVSGS